LVADMPVHALVDDCPIYNKPSQVPEYYLKNGSIDTNRYEQVIYLNAALKIVL
jgi:hypothetical protein